MHRYVDFAVWQRRRITRGLHDTQLDYWRQLLADPAPPLPWPQDGRDPESPWWAGDMAWLGLPQSLVQDAQQAARACGTSFFVLGLAVYQLALRRLTGCDRLAVGTPFAGRTDPRWADVVGFFVNTLVMPYAFRPEVPVGRLVEDTHRLVMAAHENQDLPYGVLLDELAPPVEPERTPCFQTMFILQNTPSPTRSFGSGTLATNKLVTGSARYDVTFSLAGGTASWPWSWRTGRGSSDRRRRSNWRVPSSACWRPRRRTSPRRSARWSPRRCRCRCGAGASWSRAWTGCSAA